MISFSDKAILSALSNLVAEKEDVGGSKPGAWDRLEEAMGVLVTRQTKLATLAARIDEFFSTDEDVVRSSVQSGSEPEEYSRSSLGDIESSTIGGV